MPIIDQIMPSGIRSIFDRARALELDGAKIYHFEIGQPDFDSPNCVKAAASAALKSGNVHYTPNRGLPELRRLISEKLEAENGLSYDSEHELIVTNGASEAVAMAMCALVGTGDEVIIPTPAWSHYHACATLFGATPIELPLTADDGYCLTAAKIENSITPRSKLLVINSPNNPTGAVYSVQHLAEIYDLCRRRSVRILSDEIYEYFTYGNARHHSIAALPGAKEHCVVVNGFSKAYSMTGWRLGYIAANKQISASLNKAHQYLTVCANSFAQAGACAAFSKEGKEFARKMTATFGRRVEIAKQILGNIKGVSVPAASGAFYLFPTIHFKVDGKHLYCEELCRTLLEEAHIALVPGTVFGHHHVNSVRLAYSCSEEDLRHGLAALSHFLSKK